jgi:uncharacterized damage-inducible protein DinB
MGAKTQDKKDRLIAELIETRRKILDAASALSPIEQGQVFLGIWSVKDLVAHLVGWDVANLKAMKAIGAGKLPDFYAYQDRDWKTYNARLVLRYKNNDFGKLASSAKASHEKLVNFLETLPAEEFDQDKGVRFKGYKVNIASLLQVEIKDEKVHHAQIESFSLKFGAIS